MVKGSERTLYPGAVGVGEVGRNSFLRNANAFQVPGNFIDVSFELQFQESIRVTGENKKNNRIWSLYGTFLCCLSFCFGYCHSEWHIVLWITYSTASLLQQCNLYPDVFLFLHPVHFTHFSSSATGYCWYLKGWCLEMAPSLRKAPYFSSGGVRLPQVHIIKCPLTCSFLQLFLLWAWSYFGKFLLLYLMGFYYLCSSE